LRNQIFKYLEAIKADRYRILCRIAGESNQTFLLPTKAGSREGFVLDEFTESLFMELESLLNRQFDLYFMPLSANFYYFLVDDLSKERYVKFYEEGFRPAVLLKSSPDNFQVLLKVPIPEAVLLEYHTAANSLFRELNRLYGDPAIKAVHHFHRMPGTRNFKPKHHTDAGAPQVHLIKAIDRICEKTKDLWELEIQKLRLERSLLPDISTEKITEPPTVDPGCAFSRHAEDILRFLGKSELTIDYSAVDFMIGVRMRLCGHSRKSIEETFEQFCSSLRPRDEKTKYRNWTDYVKRTVENLFGPRGNVEIQKHQNKKEIWRQIETRERRK
jgi:hypothetical protein